MIQEALSSATKHAVATSPPADLVWLVAEVLQKEHSEFRNKLKASLEREAIELAAMKARGAVIREQLWSAFSSHEVLSDHLVALSNLIEAIEEQTENAAIEISRRLKRLRKATKEIEKHVPGLKPFMAELNRTLGATSRAQTDERLEFALFLRALRAEHSRAAPVASFTDAKKLEKFLRGELGG
ncbi:MAG: hypothetical protein ACRDBL_04780 [Rhabdaerophilum sp.]